MAKVVELGMDAKKRQSTQEQERCFPLGAAETVAFLAAEPDVELVIFARPEIELVAREDSQSSDTGVGGQKFRQLQRGGRRKCEGPIKQDGSDLGHGIGPHFHNLGFADAVPVLQRGFAIPLEKIDGSQKIVGIRVARGQLKGLPHTTSGLRIAL